MDAKTREHYLRILVKCWEDPDYKARLIAAPRRVLEAEGIVLPWSGDIHVLENSDDAIYLVLPAKPAEGELADVALDGIAGGGRGQMCFITTATLKSCAMDEAEAESILDRFRAFRDQWLRPRPEGPALIDEYYHSAPVLVAALEQDPEAPRRYRELWEDYLFPCLVGIEQGRPEIAYRLYRDMLEGLKQRYPEAAR